MANLQSQESNTKDPNSFLSAIITHRAKEIKRFQDFMVGIRVKSKQKVEKDKSEEDVTITTQQNDETTPKKVEAGASGERASIPFADTTQNMEVTEHSDAWRRIHLFLGLSILGLFIAGIVGIIWAVRVHDFKSTNVPTEFPAAEGSQTPKPFFRISPTKPPSDSPLPVPILCPGVDSYFDELLYKHQDGGRNPTFNVDCNEGASMAVLTSDSLTCKVTCLASLPFHELAEVCKQQDKFALTLKGDYRDVKISIGYLHENIRLTCDSSLLLEIPSPAANPTASPFDGVELLGIAFNRILDILANPSQYTMQELDRVQNVVEQFKGSLSEEDPEVLEALSDAILRTCNTILPTSSNPITSSFEKALLRHERDVLKTMHPSEMTKHRSAESTYGSIPSTAPRLTKTIDIDTSIGRWHPTGLYAAPGELVTIEVPTSLVGKTFSVKINANWDVINQQASWERFPDVHWEFEITNETMEVANPFGGVIFVDLGGKDGFADPPNLGTLQIEISNAIEHPYFVLGVHSDDEWNERLKQKPAPYSVFVCKNLVIVQKSSDSISLRNPTELMTWWEEVVTLQDDLAGRLNPRTSPELINVDVQLEWGIGHAGYPIQAYDKYWGNLADYDRLLVDGSWGDFHEIGHNHQRKFWTFAGDIEVTVNIFSVLCMRVLAPKTSDGFKWTIDPLEVMKTAITAVSAGNKYADIPNVVLRLAFWIQLIDGFGIETMAAVFKGYEEDYGSDPSKGPANDQDKMSEWLKRFSIECGHDLTEFMVETWGLEAKASAIDAVSDLPTWMPAMGGIRGSFETERGVPITFDLAGAALSLDGIASILIVEHGVHGPVQESIDGIFIYTPISGYAGKDSFTYSVVSSSGHHFETEIDIVII